MKFKFGSDDSLEYTLKDKITGYTGIIIEKRYIINNPYYGISSKKEPMECHLFEENRLELISVAKKK